MGNQQVEVASVARLQIDGTVVIYYGQNMHLLSALLKYSNVS